VVLGFSIAQVAKPQYNVYMKTDENDNSPIEGICNRVDDVLSSLKSVENRTENQELQGDLVVFINYLKEFPKDDPDKLKVHGSTVEAFLPDEKLEFVLTTDKPVELGNAALRSIYLKYTDSNGNFSDTFELKMTGDHLELSRARIDEVGDRGGTVARANPIEASDLS
jgi:hypothetical protein